MNKILRSFYTNLRTKFKDLALRWNAILRIWNNTTPVEYEDVWIYGWDGIAIRMHDTIPVKYRYKNKKEYSGEKDEVLENIVEESDRIHTLGNENNIRRSIIDLNNKTHNYIGKDYYNKLNISIIGKPTSIDLEEKGVKKYNQLTLNPNDIIDGQQMLSNPSETSIVEYEYDSVNEKLVQKDILTFDNSSAMVLDNNDIVKKADYDSVNNVLSRIQMCIDKKNSWFSGGICSRNCQVSCQTRCQISCQACNTKQCHDQKCGTH